MCDPTKVGLVYQDTRMYCISDASLFLRYTVNQALLYVLESFPRN